jgi:hypothetical protein
MEKSVMDKFIKCIRHPIRLFGLGGFGTVFCLFSLLLIKDVQIVIGNEKRIN